MAELVKGIRITREDGQVRDVFEVCRDFVREQSAGEWSEEDITRDADKLAAIMRELMRQTMAATA